MNCLNIWKSIQYEQGTLGLATSGHTLVPQHPWHICKDVRVFEQTAKEFICRISTLAAGQYITDCFSTCQQTVLATRLPLKCT